MVQTDKTLNIKGLAGLRAETLTWDTLNTMKPGEVLTVVTTDRSAKEKLAVLCEHLGCTFLGIREEGGALCVQIRK